MDSAKEGLRLDFGAGNIVYFENVWVREHYLSGKLDGVEVTFADADYKWYLSIETIEQMKRGMFSCGIPRFIFFVGSISWEAGFWIQKGRAFQTASFRR